MKRLLLTLFVLGLAHGAFAQTVATGASKYLWTQAGQSSATAQADGYNHYLDALAPTVLTGVACVADVPVPANADCQAPMPAMTVGTHTVTISQTASGAESAKSNSVTFTFVVVVQPTNLRIAKLLGFWHGGVLSSRGRVGLRAVQIRNLRRLASQP